MVITCCVDGCPEKYSKGGTTTFHSFPKDPNKRTLWLIAIQKEEVPKEVSRVCSKHFTKKDYDRKRFGGSWLKPNAIPKLFLSTDSARSLLFPLNINLSDDETSSSSSSKLSSSSDPEEAVESTNRTSSFKSLLTPIERDSSTEELYKAGTSSSGTSSRRTPLFRLAKRCAPKVEIEDSSSVLAKRVKENDTKHISYLEYLSNIKDMDNEVSLAPSIRWDVAKQQKELERRLEVAQKEKKRLKKILKSVRRKTQYLRKLNATTLKSDKSTK